MDRTEFSEQYLQKMFPGRECELAATDPEFLGRFECFAFDEVIREPGQELEEGTRWIIILAALIGCRGIEAFRALVPAALNMGVTPVELKEIVYQAVAYLGIGRVLPFLEAANKALEERGVPLPLPGQAATTLESRRAAGTRAQVEIFGEGMEDFWRSGPEETRHINRWLAANCFGDYYTRTGLDHARRELITFCFLAAQGGCEPQLTSHAAGNLRVGNDKATLIKAVSAMVPYIGYPRCLNALRCVNEAAGAAKK